MRIAIYGGSFNPPHVGHAMVAGWLRWTDAADEVWLVPTHVHAFAKELLAFELRARMCAELARAVGPWVRVETIERDLPAPSYSIRTLDALASRHPEHDFRLVVGADVLPEVHKWRRWPEIAARYAPLVVGRQGYPSPEGAVEFPDVSSTEVRRRLREGRAVDHLVPAAVLALMTPAAFSEGAEDRSR